jgi:multidrug efflux pump subunit AcrA (membrane-fusion protein)
VVLARLHQRGEVVPAGQPIVEVADTASPLVLRTGVIASQAPALHQGDPVQVQLDSDLVAGIVGRVAVVGGSVDPQTGLVDVQVAIPTMQNLRSGTYATAELRIPQASQGGFGRLPPEALVTVSGETATLFVLDPRQMVARQVKVRFGGFDGEDVLVAGLPPGAQVIAAAAGGLRDGQKVRLAARGQ